MKTVYTKAQKAEMIDKGVAAVVEQQRWVRSTSSPVPETTVRRMFGSFFQYQELVRQAYIDLHGIPAWELPTAKKDSKRVDLITELTTITERAIENAISLTALPSKRITPAANTESPSELSIVISDVHVGEETEENLVAGLGKYDTSTFHRSADILEERLLFFNKMYGRSFPIDTLVIYFLGDIVTGESIFAGQPYEIDHGVVEQIFIAEERFTKMFQNWAAHFKNVVIYAVPGNHGRVGRKNDGLHPLTNFEFMLYRMMARRTEDIANIEWKIATGPSLIVERGEFNFLLHHGDSIPGNGPGKGNFGSLEKKLRNMSAMANVPIHFSINGHYHRASSLSMSGGGKVIVNGSFPGVSPFGVEVCQAANVPCQKLFLFNDKNGIFCETDVLLEDRVTLTPDKDGILSKNWISK